MLLVLCISVPLRAEHKWLRRASLTAACAASFWDFHSTQVAASHGAVERNPLFADANGNLQRGRMLGLKAGACAGALLIQELHLLGKGQGADRFWIAANGVSAAAFSAMALHNQRVSGALAKPAPFSYGFALSGARIPRPEKRTAADLVSK